MVNSSECAKKSKPWNHVSNQWHCLGEYCKLNWIEIKVIFQTVLGRHFCIHGKVFHSSLVTFLSIFQRLNGTDSIFGYSIWNLIIHVHNSLILFIIDPVITWSVVKYSIEASNWKMLNNPILSPIYIFFKFLLSNCFTIYNLRLLTSILNSQFLSRNNYRLFKKVLKKCVNVHIKQKKISFMATQHRLLLLKNEVCKIKMFSSVVVFYLNVSIRRVNRLDFGRWGQLL